MRKVFAKLSTESVINYGKMLDDKLKELCGCDERPRLLLHACCAPCSSYVLEYLCPYFDITLLYYNPNISPESEYNTRADELLRLVELMKAEGVKGAENVTVRVLPYTPAEFDAIAKGRENMAEGGARCFDCYRLRLEKTVQVARDGGYDYFCTTLSISPHKNAEVLNRLGGELAKNYGVKYLYSDFKKKGGYKRSCELSAHYGLYRQDYCGCIYSKNEAEKRTQMKVGTAENEAF